MKNDTIGFFGPEGWARIVDKPGHLSCTYGPDFVEARQVYFEDWTLRAYAELLSADRRLRQWQCPRLVAQLRWDGDRLHLPSGEAIALDARAAAVVAYCDGTWQARDIATALCANPFGVFDEESEVLETLDALAETHRIVWRFEVRVGDAHPQFHLRRQLGSIDDDALRSEALHGLDRLEQGREALAAAAGDATAVAEALAALNDTFEQVTNVAAARAHGETYGARTIVYEDSRRSIHVELGKSSREKLQPPLDLVLTSARWYCHQLALLMRAALREAHDRCGGGGAVTLVSFWYAVQNLFHGDGLNVSALQQDLVARWRGILPLTDGHRRLAFSASSIRAAVEESFHAVDCGWRSACHQSPDVMVAASDIAAANRGDLKFVLGELHMGINTLINHSAYHQHREPYSLLTSLRADLGMPRFIPLFSREGSRQPVRVQVVTEPGVDVEICFSHDASPLDPRTAISVGNLVVESKGDTLVVRTHDGRMSADILDVFGESMSALAVNQFRMFCHRPYLPRVTIDDLVVQRESWRVECATLESVCACPDDAEAYRLVRRWRLQTGLPEQVFVKSPLEVKPFYLDFTSPGLVRMLVKQVRAALGRDTSSCGSLVFTELLPGTKDLWLRGAEGEPFTSEFRIVAVRQDDRGLRCQIS
jgi:hypothetical protein